MYIVHFSARSRLLSLDSLIKIQYYIAYELILLFIYLSVHFFSSLLLDITHTRKFPMHNAYYINAFRIVLKAAAAWQKWQILTIFLVNFQLSWFQSIII